MGTYKQAYVLKNFFECCWILSHVTNDPLANKEVGDMTHPAQDQAKEERNRSSEVRDGNVWMSGKWSGSKGSEGKQAEKE